MAIDLTSYNAIGSGLFVRIEVDSYATSPGGAVTSTVLRFSDCNIVTTINGETYTPLGNLMGITTSTSEIQNSGDSITITLSGIPNSALAEVINSRIKGSPVQVWRMVYDAVTLEPIDTPGNPVGRFFGYVNNFSLDEQYDVLTRTSTNTIGLECTSLVSMLENKVAGRRTNPSSQKSFYPTDVSMDRVPALVGTNFDFGVPQ